MAEKMDLIIAGPANHILAVAVRQDMAGPTPAAEALVGDGLPLRDGATGDTLVRVPPEHLKVATVDRREDVMLTPRRFALVATLPEEGADPDDSSALTLDGTTITVTIPGAVTADTPAWVYLEGAAQPIVHQLLIPTGSATVSEPLQLASGAYAALLLVEGYRAATPTATVP